MSTEAVANTFWHSFLTTASLMAACELGDKTFFITSIMSLKKNRLAVFLGSSLAMGGMTFVSSEKDFQSSVNNLLLLLLHVVVFLGMLTASVPAWMVHYISVGSFLYFGSKMLLDGLRMTEEDGMEEYEEAEDEIKKKEV